MPTILTPIRRIISATDHKTLIGEREFRNALVRKAWAKDDALHPYSLLRPKLRAVLKQLEAEITR